MRFDQGEVNVAFGKQLGEVGQARAKKSPTSPGLVNPVPKVYCILKVKKLKQDLDDERSSNRNGEPFMKKMPSIDSPEMQLYEMQREASKQIHEYKLKLQKAETDIATLDGSVIRLETQSKRYKHEAEELEKSEDELKTERRKMQRELREALSLVEDLQTQNKNLNRRIEKIKQTRPTLVGQ